MKKSMRAARMERHHKRFGTATLHLVSLMDIFTILVFFLLFNSSGVHQLPNSKSITLPKSIAEEAPKETIIIMVSATDIIVQGNSIITIEELLRSDEIIIPQLKQEMLIRAQQIWDQDKVKSEDGAEVTILADKKIPYSLLKQIMQTLSQTPFKTISLAVNKQTAKKQ